MNFDFFQTIYTFAIIEMSGKNFSSITQKMTLIPPDPPFQPTVPSPPLRQRHGKWAFFRHFWPKNTYQSAPKISGKVSCNVQKLKCCLGIYLYRKKFLNFARAFLSILKKSLTNITKILIFFIRVQHKDSLENKT